MYTKLKDSIASFIVKYASTFEFFVICVILDLIDLHFLLKLNPSVSDWVNYISQTVIQLLMLPLLAYMNDKQMDKMEQILSLLLKITTKIEVEEMEEIAELKEIRRELNK